MPTSSPSLRALLRKQAGLGDTVGGCLVIGEVAQAHDGSLGLAHAFIDAIADAGADAVKFQTHIASAESTPGEPWRVKFSRQDATRYDYWKRMEFTEEQWHGLARHAHERGLLFLSSPFSLDAVELLERVGVAAWKIASGEVTNAPMLERIIETRRPVILSTGMSDVSEIDHAVERVSAARIPVAVLQCTTAYPCPPERIGINLLGAFRERYDCAVGLSDHSGTIYPGLAAATLGAQVLEIHVTLSREMFGPDVPASITTGELAQLVGGVRFIETMLAHPVDKNRVSGEMAPLRDLFTKSVVARVGIPAGTVLRAEHLAAKKPGTGIPAARLPELIGARVVREIEADELLCDADLARCD
ncbi:MAG TPA: N-acetylneuraminate synthase family protein [Gemmatimonadaceae bacterium]